MDENNFNYRQKNKITLFLERNEIWFKTVLSLTVTLAALFVSIASFSISKHQAHLSVSIAESQEREKHPFFSIENCYNDTKKQNVYVISNTGGQVRDYSISVFPFLHVEQHDSQWEIKSPLEQCDESNSQYLNHAFIYLPHFYQNESRLILENGLFAFSDILIDRSITQGSFISDSTNEDNIESELADSYFLNFVSQNNVDGILTFMSSEIVYYVEINYTNYENKPIHETLWLDRSKDLINNNDGNTYLCQNYALEHYYKEAEDKGYIYAIDSLNKPLTDIVKECKTIIELLFESFGQNSYN